MICQAVNATSRLCFRWLSTERVQLWVIIALEGHQTRLVKQEGWVGEFCLLGECSTT